MPKSTVRNWRYRIPRSAADRERFPHSLVSAEKSAGGRAPGEYVCDCGARFTGLAQYEQHRADARRNANV